MEDSAFRLAPAPAGGLSVVWVTARKRAPGHAAPLRFAPGPRLRRDHLRAVATRAHCSRPRL